MSILDRLDLLIRSNLNDALGKNSTRSALSEMESSLREARRRKAELRRAEKDLIDQIRAARDRADQWEERAMLALRNDDEELAREALIVKNEAMREAGKLRDQLDDHRAHIQDIERALEALEHKLEGTRRRMQASSESPRRIKSSSPERGEKRGAKWDEKMQQRTGKSPGTPSRSTPPDPEVSDAFDTSDKFREMRRMASKIDGMEAEIEAIRELDDIGTDSRRAELEQVFRKLETRGRPGDADRRPSEKDRQKQGGDEPPLDDDLADLKKKFE